MLKIEDNKRFDRIKSQNIKHPKDFSKRKTSFSENNSKNDVFLFGVPGGIRTPDLLVRSQTLYPAELQAQGI